MPDDWAKLLGRVRVIQAAMQAGIAAADAFADGLAQARNWLAQANQAAGTAPTPQDVQALLERLPALETALSSLPPDSSINVEQVRGQIAGLRQQVSALLPQAQALADLRAQVTSAQSRLTALDGQAAAVTKIRQSASQVLGQANALQSELQAGVSGLAATADLGMALAGPQAAAVHDATAATSAIVGDPGKPRLLGGIQRIVIHETGMDSNASPEAVVRHGANTGRKGLPYHYLVTGDGQIHQLAGLDVAVNQSRVEAVDADSVGIAFGGDFDLAVPGEAQMEAAAELLARLLVDLGLSVNTIYGRSELEGGTNSPGMQWTQGVRWGDDLKAHVAALVSAFP
jgi:hypothetical protein